MCGDVLVIQSVVTVTVSVMRPCRV
jgi:hypothetical protein